MTEWLKKFAKGCVPIVAAVLLLSIRTRRDELIAFLGLFALVAAILWFGRSWIRQTLLTRLLALFVWVFAGLGLASGALLLAIQLSLPLFILFAGGFVFLCYDLMFRQPAKGRAEMALGSAGDESRA